jgi:hypothetical protein
MLLSSGILGNAPGGTTRRIHADRGERASLFWPVRFLLSIICLILLTTISSAQTPRCVLMHHYDTLRTGWNNSEATLTPRNVTSRTFGWVLPQVNLDEQADAQPLLAHAVTIDGARRDVVYVATENDTVYAIDATTGVIITSRSLGPPVPMSVLPGQCNNNSNVVGITSTPVIDLATSAIYVMAYTYVHNKTPTWILHALDLATLKDKVAPAITRASGSLTNGTRYTFNAAVTRQRTALLEADGNIYAGYSSFCDLKTRLSRGWVLGWRAGTLAPLPANMLTNKNAHSASSYFMSNVWMSGNGIATAPRKPLFFVTGNSDPSGTSYNSVTNLSESVVALSPDLTTVKDFFTPSDPVWGVRLLDIDDTDFSAGGILLLPRQPGTSTDLAVAAGKAGQMYLLNQGSLGGYSSNGVNRVFDTHPIGGCWCGESYFTGPDGIGRVVSSGGHRIMVWKVLTSPKPALVLESRSKPLPTSVPEPGFFTSVSSNGTQNPIIWAVGRPVSWNKDSLYLYAYDPVAGAAGRTDWLFSGYVGSWPHLPGNANIVPVVANGRVYVASYKTLVILGLFPPGATSATAKPASAPASPAPTPLPAGAHETYGTIETIGDGKMTLQTRTGTLVSVAVRDAIDADLSVELRAGERVRVVGGYDAGHVLLATSIIRAKPSPKSWPPDR